MALPIGLILAGIQLGTSAYDAFKKKKIPEWYEESYDEAKLLSEEGLTPAQLSKMRVAYAPGVSRGLSERRERAASLNAARGRTGSSYGNEQILNVPTTEETIAPILADADQRAMSEGRRMLMSLTGGRMELDAENDAVSNQGLFGIGESLMNIGDIVDPQENELQDALISFLEGGGTGGGMDAPEGAGFDFDSMLQNLSEEDLQQLMAYLGNMNKTGLELPSWQQNQPLPMP